MGYVVTTTPRIAGRGAWHAVPVVREWPEGRAARGCRPGQRAAGPQRLRPGMHRLFTDGPIVARSFRLGQNFRNNRKISSGYRSADAVWAWVSFEALGERATLPGHGHLAPGHGHLAPGARSRGVRARSRPAQGAWRGALLGALGAGLVLR